MPGPHAPEQARSHSGQHHNRAEERSIAGGQLLIEADQGSSSLISATNCFPFRIFTQ